MVITARVIAIPTTKAVTVLVSGQLLNEAIRGEHVLVCQ